MQVWYVSVSHSVHLSRFSVLFAVSSPDCTHGCQLCDSLAFMQQEFKVRTERQKLHASHRHWSMLGNPLSKPKKKKKREARKPEAILPPVSHFLSFSFPLILVHSICQNLSKMLNCTHNISADFPCQTRQCLKDHQSNSCMNVNEAELTVTGDSAVLSDLKSLSMVGI